MLYIGYLKINQSSTIVHITYRTHRSSESMHRTWSNTFCSLSSIKILLYRCYTGLIEQSSIKLLIKRLVIYFRAIGRPHQRMQVPDAIFCNCVSYLYAPADSMPFPLTATHWGSTRSWLLKIHAVINLPHSGPSLLNSRLSYCISRWNYAKAHVHAQKSMHAWAADWRAPRYMATFGQGAGYEEVLMVDRVERWW